MHGQIYLAVACIAIALAAGATYALVTDGGKISATTASAIDAAQSVVPHPPVRNDARDTAPPKPKLPRVAELLRAQLASSLNVTPESVVVVNAERNTWTDSCFGLGGPAESCAQMMIEGYRVVLSAGFGRYTYRTNLDGSVIRTE